jgi:hypothetical protein
MRFDDCEHSVGSMEIWCIGHGMEWSGCVSPNIGQPQAAGDGEKCHIGAKVVAASGEALLYELP